MDFTVFNSAVNSSVLHSLITPSPHYSNISVIDYTLRSPTFDIYYSDLLAGNTLYFANMPEDGDITFNMPTNFFLEKVFFDPEVGSTRTWFVNIGNANSLTIVPESGLSVRIDQPGFGFLVLQIESLDPLVINLFNGYNSGVTGQEVDP
jgi:hypothetical protein